MLFQKLSLLLFSLTAYAADKPLVDLGYATYQGTVNATSNVTMFLGIRYAASPSGNLRWAKPQAPKPVSGLLQAIAHPPQCFQASPGQASTNPYRVEQVNMTTRAINAAGPQEDCLFLNVYTPGNVIPSSSARLPVVVWIHGGGYLAGEASSFDGQDLIRESGRGVVVVVIQYRLGVFGFLPGTAVKSGGALNAGLLDQEFALIWVRDHISKFNGNEEEVTIWGESAGAGSVLQQVIARNGETSPPLFRAAMTSSTFLPSQYKFDDEIPEKLFADVATRSNCSSSSDTLECLRKVDVTTLQAANTAINLAGFYGTFVFVPVVDGEFIVRRPTESMAMGKVNGEALLAMTNSNEGSSFVNQSTASTTNTTAYALNLFPLLSVEQAAEAATLYSIAGNTLAQLNTIMAEAIFVCPSYYLLAAFPGRSFKGEFAIPPAGHGQDISYYFPSGRVPPFNNAVFISAFSQSFLNFARSLDPNAKFDPTNITPEWDTYHENGTEMVFNRTGTSPSVHAITASDTVLERCSFWNRIGEFTGQ